MQALPSKVNSLFLKVSHVILKLGWEVNTKIQPEEKSYKKNEDILNKVSEDTVLPVANFYEIIVARVWNCRTG